MDVDILKHESRCTNCFRGVRHVWQIAQAATTSPKSDFYICGSRHRTLKFYIHVYHLIRTPFVLIKKNRVYIS